MNSWKTATQRCCQARGSISLSCTSSTRIAPAVGSTRRASNLIKVVLPAPFSPTMARLLPAGMTRLTAFKMSRGWPGY